MSGSGGHSVFSIYFDISGIGGHGGTDALSTHLDGSGSGHAGHPDEPPGIGVGQAQGRGFVQRSHVVSTKPSFGTRFPIT